MRKILIIALALSMTACQEPSNQQTASNIQTGQVYEYSGGLFTVQYVRNDTVFMVLNQHTEYPLKWTETKRNVEKFYTKKP